MSLVLDVSVSYFLEYFMGENDPNSSTKLCHCYHKDTHSSIQYKGR